MLSALCADMAESWQLIADLLPTVFNVSVWSAGQGLSLHVSVWSVGKGVVYMFQCGGWTKHRLHVSVWSVGQGVVYTCQCGVLDKA